MIEIVLVRHASSSGQWPDASLTPEGFLQAEALRDLLAEFRVERIISSPFRRALQSLEPFCARAGLQAELDPRLAECSLGGVDLPDWREQLRRSFDDLDHCPEGGESGRAAQERAKAVIRAACKSGLRCALITHGRLLALILKWVEPAFSYDDWARLSNPDVFVLRLQSGAAASFRRVWRSQAASSSKPEARTLRGE
jgi:2,3-bisphosphoglycerate-dependent phosphoglycerate mutase